MKNQNKVFLLIVGLGIFTFIASFFFKGKLDLSEDQRFTLSESTISVLKDLKQPVKIQLFLNGEQLPAGFKRLRKAAIETIEDFAEEANQPIELEYIDVYKDLDNKERDQVILNLDSLGIHPTNIIQSENGKSSQTFALPGLLLEAGGKSTGLLLLKGNQINSPEEILNQSIEQMEFQIIQAIKRLNQPQKKNIGFLFDYGTYSPTTQYDLVKSLQESYQLFPVDLENSPSLDGLDVICLIKPNKNFSEESLYKIDQFLLKGGKAVIFEEGIRVDTVKNQGIIITEKNAGLEEFYYRLGIRLNNNLLKDVQLCGAIPLEVGNFGEKGNFQLLPWPSFPLLQGNQNHPITKNLDAIFTKFGSSIDTLPTAYKKTILLHSSNYTQTMQAPATLPFASSTEDFNPKKYKEGIKFGAVLIEGKFESYFKNKILPNENLKKGYLESGKNEGKIVLIGNSSMVENAMDPTTKAPMELGYDLFSQHTFGNKDFILNVFNYLTEGKSSLLAREKNFQLRPLDKKKIQEKGNIIQIINISLPIFLSLLLAGIIYYRRKEKYSK